MNRILVFHFHDPSSETRMAPSAYYIKGDYSKVAVRIYASGAPTRDAKIDIFDDGVSIFNNSTPTQYNILTGANISAASDTSVKLPSGQNSDDFSDDFNNNVIEDGSWIYCNLIDAGGGKNFTVQLELHQTSEDEDLED